MVKAKVKPQESISQIVCLGPRFAPKNLGMLYQDEVKNGTRLRIVLDGEMIGGVVFQNKTPRDYYFAMQKLSKKIGKPIQYVILYQPILPLVEEKYE